MKNRLVLAACVGLLGCEPIPEDKWGLADRLKVRAALTFDSPYGHSPFQEGVFEAVVTKHYADSIVGYGTKDQAFSATGLIARFPLNGAECEWRSDGPPVSGYVSVSLYFDDHLEGQQWRAAVEMDVEADGTSVCTTDGVPVTRSNIRQRVVVSIPRPLCEQNGDYLVIDGDVHSSFKVNQFTNCPGHDMKFAAKVETIDD